MPLVTPHAQARLDACTGELHRRRSRIRSGEGRTRTRFRSGGFGDFKTQISRSGAVPDAQQVSKTIFQTEPGHKVAEEYRQLAREFLERLQHAEQQSAEATKGEEISGGGGRHGEAA